MKDFTLEALDSVLAVRTEKVWLVLLELTHADWDTPIRLVNNTEDITHAGNVYRAHPFQVRLPRDDGDQLPKMNITLDVVAEDAYRAKFREVPTPPSCTVKVILSDDPDYVQSGPYQFDVKRNTMNQNTATLELSPEDILGRRYPNVLMTPATVPGLFK